MKRKTVKIIFFVFLANLLFFGSCSALFVWGCRTIPFGDGGLSVTGNAYEWINPPANATSQIFVVNAETGKVVDIESALKQALDDIPPTISKIPLENVSVSFGSKANSSSNKNTVEYLALTSDLSGEFSGFQMVAPGTYPLQVKAMKQGYQEVIKDFQHDRINHVIIAILVKDK